MSSNNIGSIYTTTVSSKKYIIIDSQNIELSGNVIMKEHVTISGNLEPFAISNTSKLGSATKLWSNAYITNISTSNISISEGITLPANSINSYHIQNETILEDKIGASAVTENKIGDSAVTENKIGDSAVTENKIGPLAVTGNKIAEGTIDFSKFTADAITTLQTTPPNSINSNHIQTGTITGSNIAQRTIGADKIDNSGTWTFTNISGTHMSLSGDLEPLIPNSTSKLGSTAKYWSSAYITNISASNISISGNIILNISGSNIRNINQLSTDVSNNKITTTHRIYQQISGDISWSAVNGYNGLAKDAYPALNPLSSGAKALQTWTSRSVNNAIRWHGICWSPELRIFVATSDVKGTTSHRVMWSYNGIDWNPVVVEQNHWRSVCWSPKHKIFVAVASGGETNYRVMISNDGKIWTPKLLDGTNLNNAWYRVIWCVELEIFVAISYGFITTDNNNRVMYSRSSDASTWNEVDLGSILGTSGWYGLCWSPELGIFVAVATYNSNGKNVMTSRNGINWTPQVGSSSNGWVGVCWSSELGLFVAVAYAGETNQHIMTSKDGKTWITNTQILQYPVQLWNVCWCSELKLFVAIGSDKNGNGIDTSGIHTYGVITSPNGKNWTQISVTNVSSWSNICWSPELGIFVIIAVEGNTRLMTSSLKARPPTSYNVFDSSFNAIDESGNWSFSNISVSNISVSGNIVSNISVSGNIILNISGSNIRNINQLSADVINNKITTTHRIYQEISGDISWSAVNGYYGLAKDAYPALNPLSSGEKAVSSWTKRTTYANDSSTWNSICWSPKLGIFVAVASSGTKRVMTSKNGIVWSTVDLSNNNTQLTSVCWSPQLEIFVAVFETNTSDTSANKVVTSSNGTTWIERENGVNRNGWTSVCWSVELTLFVAVASTGTNPRVMYSSDGIRWNYNTSGVNNSNNWNSICWSAELGIFVAVAGDGIGTNSVMTSKNGKDWTSLVSPITVFSICWSAQLGIFVAVGGYNTNNNNVMISSDGKNWITRPLVSTGSAVCWSESLGIFVVTTNQADNGIPRMMYSYDGLNWIPIPNIEFQHWSSICWSSELGIFAVVGYLASSDYFNTKVMTSSLQGRPPTSYNVFDSSFNAIDESGNWTFQNIDISSNLYPSLSIETTKIEASGNYSNFVPTSTYFYYIYTNVGNWSFIPQQSDTFDVLIVGGGGGGGSNMGGGGGGGGVIYLRSVKLSSGISYPVIVGSGGASDTNGNPSSFNGAVAAGGGAGGGNFLSATASGHAGGCGGGACTNNSSAWPLYTGGESIGNRLGPNLGTIYGSRGGSLSVSKTSGAALATPMRSAGGGGAGGAALNTNPNTLMTSLSEEGSGGIGTANTMYLGNFYYWGGGGGGAAHVNQNGGYGGLGGGGGGASWTGGGIGLGGGVTYGTAVNAMNNGENGGVSTSDAVGGTGGAGGACTGGGGGGGSYYNGLGGNGGSGIVIIRCSRTAYSNNTNIGLTTKPWNNAVINNLTVNKLTIGDTNSVDVINNLLNRVSILENKISNSVYKIEYFRWASTSYSGPNDDRSYSYAFAPNNAISQFTKKGNTKIRIKSSFSYNMGGWAADYIRARLSIYQGNTLGNTFTFVLSGADLFQGYNTDTYPGGSTRSGVLSGVSVFMDTAPLIAMNGTFAVRLEIDKTGFDDNIWIYAGHHEVTHLYA